MADNDAFAATTDPRMAPQGDALAARPSGDALAARGASADPLSADYQPLREDLRTISDIRGSMAERQRTGQQREQALEQPRAEMLQRLRQPVPQPPQQQQLPPTPKRNEPGADESWLMVAGVLGAIAGGLTRNHTTNALAAMTGAMEGYNEGSKQKFDQNLKLWDAESKKILETNRQANESYTQILQSNKLALEQKSMEIQMTAAKFDDRAAMQLAQTKDFETLGRLIQQRMDKQQQMEHWDAQLRQQHEGMLQRERQAREANESRERAAAMRANSRGAAMSPEAIDLRVDMAITGNPNATKGLRAGSPDMEAFSNRLAEVAKERGLDANEIARMQQQYQGGVSGARSTGTRLSNLEQIQRSVNSLLPQALDASAALSRTRWVPVNQAIQLAQSAKSTPELEAFATVNINLAEQWARSQKPGGVLDVELQKLALGRLSTAKSDQAYRTIVNAIVESIDRERKAAIAQSRNEPMERPAVPGAFVPPKTGGATAPTARRGMSGDMPVPNPSTLDLGDGWSVQMGR